MKALSFCFVLVLWVPSLVLAQGTDHSLSTSVTVEGTLSGIFPVQVGDSSVCFTIRVKNPQSTFSYSAINSYCVDRSNFVGFWPPSGLQEAQKGTFITLYGRYVRGSSGIAFLKWESYSLGLFRYLGDDYNTFNLEFGDHIFNMRDESPKFPWEVSGSIFTLECGGFLKDCK